MGAQEPNPGQESERQQFGPGVGSGVRFGKGEVGFGSCGASRGARSCRSSFQGEKIEFFSSHKVCIVAQRGALMTAKGLRGRDNLASVPPAPRADRLPEGYKQSPAAKPLPFSVRHRLRGG